MNVIKLIIGFITAAVAVLNKAITKAEKRALNADAEAVVLRDKAYTLDVEAEEQREQARQAAVLVGKLNQLIEG